MKNSYFIISSALLLLLQIATWNFLNLPPLVVICFLPALILSLPAQRSPSTVLIVAFVAGIVVDFFSHGALGLSAAALLPVALLRPLIMKLVFGVDFSIRGEDISLARYGLRKMVISVAVCTLVFFAVYVPVDSAGTRTLMFNLERIAYSTLASFPLCLVAAALLTSEKWK